jgi:tRNA(Ile)-lysidine synthetase-like protein
LKAVVIETLDKVAGYIGRHRSIEGARGILVAVSGGPDSVALLDMLVRLQPSARLHVAHLDHMLRGRESAEDARFVRALAKQLGVASTVRKIDVRRSAKEAGRGVEEIAREIRYSFLLRMAHRTGCDRIATGHTMSDQAETLLMRLARGSGLRGLAGMRPVAQAHIFAENGRMPERDGLRVEVPTSPLAPISASATGAPSQFSRPLLIRPLLCITRDEVEAYCNERHLEFRTDPSNLHGEYTRNHVRTVVLPALREVNPYVVEHIAATAEIIADDQDSLDQLAAGLLDQARQLGPLSDVTDEASAYSVPGLLRQPPGLRRRMIIKAIERARAGVRGTEPLEQIGRVHLDAVEELMADGASGSRIMLPGSFEVWREFDALVFLPSGSPAPASSDQEENREYLFEISVLIPFAEAGGFGISLVRGQPGDLLQPAIEQARRERERLGNAWMTAVLDDHVLPDRLVVRPRRRGERACVLGHKQTKKLKKLMIDHRIPTSRRAIWPIVATPDGQYVWSPGLPPADEFAARDETHGLAILRASGV